MDAQERIEDLEQQVEELQDRLPDGVNRREFGKTAGALGLGALLGGGGAATAIDSADASHGSGSIGTESDPVSAIYAHQFGSANQPIQSLHADSQTDLTLGSLSTRSASITSDLSADLNQGTPSDPDLPLTHGSGADLTGIGTAATSVAGDNSATTIFDPAGSGLYTGLLVVSGNKSGGSLTAFSDIVALARVTKPTRIGQSTRNNPGARTYSTQNGNVKVAIDDSGSTYDVTVFCIGGIQS